MKRLLLLVSLVALSFSCTKEPVQEPVQDDPQIFRVTIGVASEVSQSQSQGQSKVAVDNKTWKSTWDTDDTVGAWMCEVPGKLIPMTIAEGDYDPQNATFSGELPGVAGCPFRLVYPYNSEATVPLIGGFRLDISSQNGDVSDPYLISESTISKADKMTPDMMHVGAFLILKADFATLLAQHTELTSLTLDRVLISNVPTSGEVNLIRDIDVPGFLSDYNNGVIDVALETPIEITSAASATTVNLQILPFDVPSGDELEVILKLKGSDGVSYYSQITKMNNSTARSFERATYNTINLVPTALSTATACYINNEDDLRAVGKGDYFVEYLNKWVYRGDWSLDADYILASDITLTEDWESIGTADNPFTGTFTGKDDGGDVHTISGLRVSATDETEASDNQGFFGVSSGEITYLTLVDCDIAGRDNVGSVVGLNSGLVHRCIASGSVVGDAYVSTYGHQVGGIVGTSTGTITQCISETTVTGQGNVGGIVGYLEEGYVVSCAHVAGKVTSTGVNAGGVVGAGEDEILLQNVVEVVGCYNLATVKAELYMAGGVVGNYGGYARGCYNTGDVISSDDPRSAGGIAGTQDGEYIRNYYLDTSVRYGRGYTSTTEPTEDEYNVVEGRGRSSMINLSYDLTDAVARYNNVVNYTVKGCAFKSGSTADPATDYPVIDFTTIASN